MELFKKMTFTEFFCLLVILLCFTFYFSVSFMSFYRPVPADISEIKIAIIGIGGSVVGYVVGSSVSSRKKDIAIQDAIKNNSTTPTP